MDSENESIKKSSRGAQHLPAQVNKEHREEWEEDLTST